MTTDHTAPTRRIAFPKERVRRPGRMELRVLNGDAPGKIVLDAPIVTVGRGRLADLTIKERSISSAHFELRATASGVIVRDLDSTNGLWFCERRLFGSVELQDGDSFRAGECEFLIARVEEVEVELLATDKYGRLHGASLPMRELYTQLDRLAPTPLSVLLLGETGTGKELTAQAIHSRSGRRGPLVVLDCGALSPSLAEATLFGVRKGAFTGADRDQAGKFEAADGGTLFIDEIGELAPQLQVKLLRALEDGRITRVGESTPSAEVDVRVIAATHRDLRLAIGEDRFRDDLYFRLAQATVRIPPLRERGDDILMLAQIFLGEVRQDTGANIELGDDAARALRDHAWPGNVRELRNTVRQAAYLQRGSELTPADLRLGARQLQQPPGLVEMALEGASHAQIHAAVDKLILPPLLEAHDHNLSSLADALEKNRDTLRKRIRELGLASRS